MLLGFTLAGAAGCSGEAPGVEVPNPLTNPKDGPPAGNPNAEATCAVPAEAGLADVSRPTTVVGTGTPASCTPDAFVQAVPGRGQRRGHLQRRQHHHRGHPIDD